MSIAYKKRKKAIRDEKKRRQPLRFGHGLDHGQIPLKDFRYMQANWHRQVIGPPIGTLEQLISGESK